MKPDQSLSTEHHFNRRQLLVKSAWSALLLALGSLDAGAETVPADTTPIQMGNEEWNTLRAAVSRILPSDGSPGATEANVIGFIKKQIEDPELSGITPVLAKTAELLNRFATLQFKQDFLAVDDTRKDLILQALATNQIPVRKFPQTQAFRLLHALTLEGFLSDPRHGGNANEVGWSSLGIPPPHRRSPGEVGHDHHH